MKKTLIFCFDGTCNDPDDAGNYEEDESITNILKLYVLFGGSLRRESKNLTYSGTFTNGNGLQQRSFYYSGVGTYGGRFRKLRNTLFAPQHEDVESILKAATKDLKAAIKDLKKHDQEDSHEYIHVLVFGFSRGAALARMFAAKARGKSGIKDLKIDFLGVFDTVAAISSRSRGIGTDLIVKTKPASDVVFENGTMSQDVRKAVHLVALDENRVAFQPTLFDHDPNRITEVWFPGVHSDVGGGYWYDGLSDLALEYMIKKVEKECKGYIEIQDSEKVDYDQLTYKRCNDDEDCTKITEDDIKKKPLADGILHEHKRKTTSITTTISSGITTAIATAATAGVATAATYYLTVGEAIVVAVGVITGVIATILATIAAGGIATAAFSVKAGIAVGVASGIGTGAIIGGIVYVLTGVPATVPATVSVVVAAGVIIGVIVGKKVGKMIRKTLDSRQVRIAGNPPQKEHPMVHKSVQDRYKEVRGYRPHALRDVKYFLNTDDKQNGEPRQGVSALGMEQKTKGTDTK